MCDALCVVYNDVYMYVCMYNNVGSVPLLFADMYWTPLVNGEVPENAVVSVWGAYHARYVRPSDTIPGVYSTVLRSFYGAFDVEAITSTENIEVFNTACLHNNILSSAVVASRGFSRGMGPADDEIPRVWVTYIPQNHD